MTGSGNGLQSVERTIIFVDLAGFTSLTDAHGDDVAASTQAAFFATLTDALGESVECVKHLGDGALLAANDGAAALACLRDIAQRWATDPHAPLIRAGAHTGLVLRTATEHGPDYVGQHVNIAARLCELAAGGQLMLSETLSAAAGRVGLQARDLGPTRLRGISLPITLHVADLTNTEATAIDPVCRMPVPRGTEAGTLRHDGSLEYFCSLACVATFSANPGDYRSAEATPRW